jgi:hypothetical protein
MFGCDLWEKAYVQVSKARKIKARKIDSAVGLARRAG